MSMERCNIQGGPKKRAHFLWALTSSNNDRFSNLFHCLNQENICNNTVSKDPTTPIVCRYTTSWRNVNVLKATIENKTTSVTTHFKKLTTRTTCFLFQLLCRVTIASCSFYIKCVRLAARRRTLCLCSPCPLRVGYNYISNSVIAVILLLLLWENK